MNELRSWRRRGYHAQYLNVMGNKIGPEGAKSVGALLKTNNTLTQLDVSDNKIEAEGAAALADGLLSNSVLLCLHVSNCSMSTAAAEAFGGMLSESTTLKTLDVSGNNFGKLAVGDQVKLKSSGEMKVVTHVEDNGRVKTDSSQSSSGLNTGWFKPEDVEWKSQISALCAGVAASPSLISVSTIFRHALAVSISHLLSFQPCT
jgi:hypothetical protein